MLKRQDPREVLASALKELSLHRSVAKITIQDITEACGYSRKNFYYYFHDKYELISWYFNYEGDRFLQEHIQEDWSDILVLFLEDMKRYREYYLAIFTDNAQVPLADQYFDFIVRTMSQYMLVRQESVSPVERFYLRYVAYANTRMTKDWLEAGCVMNTGEYAKLLVDAYPEALKGIFR